MSDDTKRPEGFYSRYLRLLGERRAAAGEPAPDIFPPDYWREREAWRDQHGLNEAECRRGDEPARRNTLTEESTK
jgi:hypothetical protein